MSNPPDSIDYGQGIHCLDTQYQRPGLAACYLLQSDQELAFVDTGTAHSLPLALALLEQLSLSPEQVRYVMPTHVHLDHAGGAGHMMECFPNARLVVHPLGARHLIDPQKLQAGTIAVYGEETFRALYDRILPVPASRVTEAEDGLQLPLGSRTLECIDSPGHARHHYCIHDHQSGGIFSGDTFGLGYPELTTPNGRFVMATTTPVQFDPGAWHQTLDRLLARSPLAMYLTHFGKLDRVAECAELLREGIDRHVEIARQAPSNDRQKWMEQALLDWHLQKLAAMGCDLPASRIEEIIGMDLQLNAQGLGVWLDRQTPAQKA